MADREHVYTSVMAVDENGRMVLMIADGLLDELLREADVLTERGDHGLSAGVRLAWSIAERRARDPEVPEAFPLRAKAWLEAHAVQGSDGDLLVGTSDETARALARLMAAVREETIRMCQARWDPAGLASALRSVLDGLMPKGDGWVAKGAISPSLVRYARALVDRLGVVR